MSARNKISLVVGLVLLVTILSFLLSWPVRMVQLSLLGLDLTIEVTAPWFLGLLLAAVVAVESDSLVRGHPAAINAGLGYALTFWPLPCLLTWLALPLLHQWRNPLYWGGGALALVVALAAVLMAQYASISRESEARYPSRWFLNLCGYAMAFLLYQQALSHWGDGVRVALAAGAIGAAFSLGLLRTQPGDVGRTWLYALLVGLVMGELGWVLSYWRAEALLKALFLFGSFYLASSVLQQHLVGRLTRAAVIEFAALGLAALGAFWYLAA
ncbi:MAG: hypothetical protein GXY76_03625 [Chloroflexi bacterium]|nr:hypothetical protein [Chloroflexota bacterium]